jgi:hypothetical protein
MTTQPQPTRRVDRSGRDVTDLPGLWDESDVITCFDRNGRPVVAGDILKVWHFVAYNRRKCFMYKKVFRVSDEGDLDPQGRFLYALDLQELGLRPLHLVHKCRVDWLDEFEIIDGPTKTNGNGEMVCWWERKKRKATST